MTICVVCVCCVQVCVCVLCVLCSKYSSKYTHADLSQTVMFCCIRCLNTGLSAVDVSPVLTRFQFSANSTIVASSVLFLEKGTILQDDTKQLHLY